MEVKTQSPPKHGPRPVEAKGEPCILGREVNFKGTLEATEDLTILGRVDGRILAKGALIIGKEAHATASVEGKRILVLGRVKGNIRGSERIELGPTSTVEGDVAAPLIQISEGAHFEGRVHRPDKVEAGSGLSRLLGR